MMTKRSKRRNSLYLLGILIAIGFSSSYGGTGFADTVSQNSTLNSSVYLPFVTRPGRPQNIFGVETAWVDPNLISKANGVNAYWWRYFAFSWKDIEPLDVDPAQYNWTAVNENHLIEVSKNQFSMVAIVRNIPYFAQKIVDPNSIPCSPIKDDPGTIADFQEFISALATRYSAPPYNIHYWQFINEPDVSPISFGIPEIYSTPFGCWGDTADPYFGGEYYGKFLKIFSESIKAVDPIAKVTNGGLLLDCDPANDPQNCKSGTFFEGVIKYLDINNALTALDYASFHAYTGWYGDLSLDENWPGFAPQGGVLVGKAFFLRQVMSNYGINPTKPLLVTEGGLMCRRDPIYPLPSGKKCTDLVPPPEYGSDQAEYVVWLYVRAIAEDISGVMWYTLNYQPYRHVGLLNADGSPKPAYTAYQFLVSQIGSALFSGKLNQFFPTFRAYEFTKNAQRIWIVWTPDQTGHSFDLPAGFQAAYDHLGTQINVPPGTTAITIDSPVYLILN